MRTKIVDHAEAKTVSAKTGTKQWPTLLLLLLSVGFGASRYDGVSFIITLFF